MSINYLSLIIYIVNTILSKKYMNVGYEVIYFLKFFFFVIVTFKFLYELSVIHYLQHSPKKLKRMMIAPLKRRAESSGCVRRRRRKVFRPTDFSFAQRSEESAPFQWGYHEVWVDPSEENESTKW